MYQCTIGHLCLSCGWNVVENRSWQPSKDEYAIRNEGIGSHDEK